MQNRGLVCGTFSTHEKTYLSGVTQLTKSVLGRKVEIDGKESEVQDPTSLMLGDGTKVNLKNG